jgi:hypothetical protein
MRRRGFPVRRHQREEGGSYWGGRKVEIRKMDPKPL